MVKCGLTNRVLTSMQNIAYRLQLDFIDDKPRRDWTWDDFVRIAEKIPKVESCYAYVNQRLGEMARAGFVPYEICHFKAGDLKPRYEKFPTSLSKETVRRTIAKVQGELNDAKVFYEKMFSVSV